MKKQKNKKAFTLVELIVVITILAILATIAFISFQSYTKNARDWNRIANLNNIDKWLNIYKTQKWKYPTPDNINWTWTLNWKELVYVWEIWKNIQRLINLNSLPKDPLTNDEFFYWVSKDAENYQLATIYETELSKGVLTTTYADSWYKAKVLWNYEWILKYNSWWICISNIPSLLFSTWWEIDLKNESVWFIVDKWENLPYKSLKWKSAIKPTTDILKMVSNTWNVTTECKTEEEWKEAFLEDQKKEEIETKFWYEIDKTWKQIFWDKYFKEVKKEAWISLWTDLYSLTDDELKNIFTSKNVFTNSWENTSLCNISSMKIDSTTFHPWTYNQDLTFTWNTIYKIPAWEYVFSKANVDESYFTKYWDNCVWFIWEWKNKTIIKNTDSWDSIFLVDWWNNIILSWFSINRDEPNEKITWIHVKSSSNNTTLTNIEVKNQNVWVWTEWNTNIWFLNINNNETWIRNTSWNISVKSTTSSWNIHDWIDIYWWSNHIIEDSYFNNNSSNWIFHSSWELTIKNSSFNNNTSMWIYNANWNISIYNTTSNWNNNWYWLGVYWTSNAIIENSSFNDNSWMWLYYSTSTSSNLSIKWSNFNWNTWNWIWIYGSGDRIIENSFIKNNVWEWIYHASWNLSIMSTIFSWNTWNWISIFWEENHSIKNSSFEWNNGNWVSSHWPTNIENITLSNNKQNWIEIYTDNNTINTVTSNNNLWDWFKLYWSLNTISNVTTQNNEKSWFNIYAWWNNQITNLNSSNNKENWLLIEYSQNNTINTLDANNNLSNWIKIETWAKNNIVNSYEWWIVVNDWWTTNIIYARWAL